MIFSVITPIFVLALSGYIYYYYFSATPCADANCFFSTSFEEAQEKFRVAASKYPQAKLTSREVVDGLSTQFLLFPGREDSVLLYFAGTHGIEGYAGSAAQLSVLDDFNHTQSDPTVVFIHPLNPFGMKHFRRVNEDNIDLNRNCLEPHKFDERRKQPNIAGYEDLNDKLNPVGSDSVWYNLFATLGAALHMISDMKRVKRAIVAAQYHDPRGVQYGGSEKAQSHLNVEEYLKENLNLPVVKSMFLLDEHTGLGPYGVDTLLVHGEQRGDVNPKGVFKTETSGAGKVEIMSEDGGPVSSGYELTIGLTDCYQDSFPNAKTSLIVTQEFGTVPTPIVGMVMTADNLNWIYDTDPAQRAQFTTFAFRVKGAPWEKEIIRRGRIVFFELWNHLIEASKSP